MKSSGYIRVLREDYRGLPTGARLGFQSRPGLPLSVLSFPAVAGTSHGSLLASGCELEDRDLVENLSRLKLSCGKVRVVGRIRIVLCF